jgi:hypothetical protein
MIFTAHIQREMRRVKTPRRGGELCASVFKSEQTKT